ncbi:DUF2461 domain-containing protein [Pedobacter sp. SYSU D00535]|uniref:DUF2461 domain-containing protein n=1 Tax=Pedobacter sp. SYSU D00535 TaxID=2810308 RepID=UPI001A96302C|nr:DUF2461 domain-containing protein [Pedobacter sp. SYSU D00535]
MITRSTLDFLSKLQENNHREWFQEHKSEYESARENVYEFTLALIKILSEIDPTVPADLDPKNCVMRIYRDIRFSKDKTPYKTNFGIAISGNGKNFKGPGYYFHIQPGKSFIAGGSWFPGAEELKAIRQEIDYNASDFHDLVNDAAFKEMFGDLDTEGKLKTVPKGYSADHPEIEYLKLKSFTVSRLVTDAELSSPKVNALAQAAFEKLYPLIVFLRNAIA